MFLSKEDLRPLRQFGKSLPTSQIFEHLVEFALDVLLGFAGLLQLAGLLPLLCGAGLLQRRRRLGQHPPTHPLQIRSHLLKLVGSRGIAQTVVGQLCCEASCRSLDGTES